MFDFVGVRPTVRAIVNNEPLLNVFAAHVLVDLRR
jgi:hypothetical protein